MDASVQSCYVRIHLVYLSCSQENTLVGTQLRFCKQCRTWVEW